MPDYRNAFDDEPYTPDRAAFLRSERALAGTGEARPYHQSWRDRLGETISDGYEYLTGSRAAGNNLAHYTVGSAGMGPRSGTLRPPAVDSAIDAADNAFSGNYSQAAKDAAWAGLEGFGGKAAHLTVNALLKGPWIGYVRQPFTVASKNGRAVADGYVDGNNIHILMVGRPGDGARFAEPASAAANTVGHSEIRSIFNQLKDEYPLARTLTADRISGARGAASYRMPAGAYGQPSYIPDGVMEAIRRLPQPVSEVASKGIAKLPGNDATVMRIDIPRGY